VELKNLIDHAHRYLPKIGQCLSLELKFRRVHIDYLKDNEDRYYYNDDDDDDDDDGDDDGNGGKEEEKQEIKLEEIQNKLVKIYDLEGFRMEKSGFEDSSIVVLGKEIQSLGDISLEDVEKWYSAGTNSKCHKARNPT